MVLIANIQTKNPDVITEKTFPSTYSLRFVLGNAAFKNPLLYSCKKESLHGSTAATGMAKDII